MLRFADRPIVRISILRSYLLVLLIHSLPDFTRYMVSVYHAIEVIGFVLQNLRQKPIGAKLGWFAALVDAAHSD